MIEKDFLEEAEKEKKELAESYKESVRQNKERTSKSLKTLPKLKQDIVKSITQISLNKKYGDLVENIIERKLSERKEKK